MAKQSQVTRTDRKAELVSELAWSRAELTRNLHDTRNDLDLVAHFKQSVVHSKTAWITGAAVTGWILSRLPGRKKKQATSKALPVENSRGGSERTGVLIGLLGVLFNFAKPILTAMATRKISEMAARSSGGWRNP